MCVCIKCMFLSGEEVGQMLLFIEDSQILEYLFLVAAACSYNKALASLPWSLELV